MKYFFLFFIAFAFCTVLRAQQYQSLGNEASKPLYTIISSTPDETVIEFNFQGFYLSNVNTPQGVKKSVSMEDASPMLVKGEPALLKVSRSVIIPDQAEMKMKILSTSYVDFNNVEIVPSKGNFTRDIDPSTVSYEWGRTYMQNGTFPSQFATLSSPHILRDYRGVTVNVFPLQYNHASHSLRAIKTIRVSIYKSSSNAGENSLIRTKAFNKVDEDFDQLYSRHFINYNQVKYTSVAERGNILVISYGSYMDAMAPYVQWKNRIGFPTTIVDVASIGTTATAIKTYVANYYNTNGLTFLLLVGDGQHIPPVTSGVGGPSDNAYAYVSGSDHYPEFYVGRFSAESTADVDVQVLRTIQYEQNPDVSSDWLNRVLGIGSDQGPGDDNEYDYAHIRNLETQCGNYEYTTKYELFDGSQGGLDASGDPTAANVSTIVNNGTGLILYTGHGSDFSFVTTGFSVTNVNALTNTTQWPFIFSVACVNGNFQGQTCFAEAWLRARSGTTPKGAVATIMSTINQSWNPPMEGEDEMVNVLTENASGNIKHTFGAIVMSGCMKMNDTYGSGGDEMTDTWTVFGDPSLMVRTDTAKSMIVTHVPTVPVGTSSLTVNCNTDGAFVTVTMNDVILGTGVISGGSVVVNFTALAGIDTLFVTATKYNYIPYMHEVPIIAATGPYVVYDSYVIDDAAGNSNAQADYNESMLLNLTLENVGVAATSNVVASISTTNPNITITDNSESYGVINASATKNINGAYAVSVNSSIADQTSVLFSLNAVDGASNWSSSFNMLVNAPLLEIGTLIIDDASGNNNGRLDPGETVNITIQSMNNGHAAYASADGNISSGSSFLNITSGSASLGNLAIAGSANPSFAFTVDAGTPMGTSVDITYTLGAGFYQVQHVFNLKVGIADEDYETGDFTQYSWTTSGSQPWFVSTESPYEGTYCSQSGSISDNQSSVMSIVWDVASPDTISFFRKVDCEEGSASGSQWDYLEFKIDNTSKQWWDGSHGWERFAYAVTAGQHTFLWQYVKDVTVSEGEDAGWIDYIVFPPITTTIGCDEIPAFSFNVYPNPSVDLVNVELNLQKSTHVKVDLLNNLGQIIAALYDGNMEQGVQQISFNPSELLGGQFFVRVRTDEGTMTRMIVTGNK